MRTHPTRTNTSYSYNATHPTHHYPISPLTIPLGLDVEPPLRPHPHQARRRDNDGSHKRLSPPGGPIHPPLAHKVRPGHGIRPQGQLVHSGVVNVVGGVEAHDGRQERPGAEGARRQPGDVRGAADGRIDGRGVVHARRVVERRVGLD
jgi:hypothetical protein